MSSCEKKSKQKIFVFKENRSILQLSNTDEVPSKTITVDGCAILTWVRCDYLHIAKEIEMYIELKGCDIKA